MQLHDATGKRLAGAWVTAKALQAGQSASDVTYPGAWGPPIAATSDSQGGFGLENLNPGTYAIEARTPLGRAPAVVVEVPDAPPPAPGAGIDGEEGGSPPGVAA